MRKPKKPKPRNPIAREMLTTGAFKQRTVPPEGKDPKKSRRSSKRALRDPEQDA